MLITFNIITFNILILPYILYDFYLKKIKIVVILKI